jgi:uncharacterized membrane-anchored protein YitT (DUF2179 family)
MVVVTVLALGIIGYFFISNRVALFTGVIGAAALALSGSYLAEWRYRGKISAGAARASQFILALIAGLIALVIGRLR